MLAAAAVFAVAAVGSTALLAVNGLSRDAAALTSIQAVLSQQQDADMMHDALRSDVLASIPVSRPDTTGTLAAAARDAQQLRAGLAANSTQLAQLRDPRLVRVYETTRRDLDRYAAEAERAVALAVSDPKSAQRALPAFNTSFERARIEMDELTTLLRTDAGRASAASTRAAQAHRRRTAEIGVLAALLVLLLTGAVRRSVRRSLGDKAAAEAAVQRANAQLTSDAARESFDATLKDAFDMATTELEARAVVRRAVVHLVPTHRAELLLADNSRAHLDRAMTEPGDDAPGCGVLTPSDCIAVRRGRPVTFSDAEGIGSCPKLVGRAGDIGHAACSPVTFLGEGLGVLHIVTRPGETLEPEVERGLSVTAEQAGIRIGTLRAFSRSQLQASTDGLTGLLNRRTIEERIGSLQGDGHPVSLALCDLDHFKTVNDTFGHEAGDRALRVFSATLRSVMRGQDLVARYGGEEFLLAMPDCDLRSAQEVLQRVRTELALTLDAGGAPCFTASFGLTVLEPGQPLEEAVRSADVALMQAKTEGRDRVVVCSVADRTR